MKHSLYSELRTVTPAATALSAVTLKMKDMIDENILKDAVRVTSSRYPYFSMRLDFEQDSVCFADNDAPMPVLHTDGPVILGGDQVAGHLLAVSWWKNKIHIEVYHALTDGGGVYNFIKTLLYYYCSAYYEVELSPIDIRLAGEEIAPEEWSDPGAVPMGDAPDYVMKKWENPAFQLKGGGKITLSKSCIVYNIRIPEAEFMRFNLSNDGSPGTIVALFLARAIEACHPEKKDPVVIAMCVNQRKALSAPLAHQSLVGDVRLAYRGRIKDMPFMDQATCFRGMVALQSDRSMVREEIREYQRIVEDLRALPTHLQRHQYCIDRMNHMTDCFTATISYVGKTGMGDAEQFIQEFHVLPSTALPSSATPLTLELSAMNGCFYVNFMQYFPEDCYLKAFIKELRKNQINYDVLYQEETKYPGMIELWDNL